MFNTRRANNRPSVRSPKRLRFEALEPRAMLSVTAFMAGNTLNIQGDAHNNSIQAWETGSTWNVQGVNGTKVNGSAAAQTFTGVDNLSAYLGTGNDFVQIQNGAVSGALGVAYGKSTDQGTKITLLSNLQVGSLLVQDKGSGSNSLAAFDVQASGRATIALGGGANNVSLTDLTLGNLSISSGGGNDGVTLAGVTTTGSTGDTITTGNGRDSIAVSNFTSSDVLAVQAGDGADMVTLLSDNVGDNTLSVKFLGGVGDLVTATDCTANVGLFTDPRGSGGFISGIGNQFATTTAGPQFTHPSGDFQ